MRALAVVPTPERTPLATIRASGVVMRSITWIDRPLLQDAAFHLIAGPKGVGKGTWLARVTAQMTTGGYGSPREALILSSEDSASIDTTPRLVAAGADLDRVHLITSPVTFPVDLDRLHDLAVAVGNVGLIVVDPLGNHLGGVDTDKEGAVRFAIGGLNELADELGCAVIGVRHFGKARQNGALASVLGSTAWVDLPRAVLAFARDNEDPDVFHVQVAGGNRSAHGQGVAFRIELRDVPGLAEPVTAAVPLGQSSKDVDELLAAPKRSSKSKSARELILDILDAEGEQESDALDARVAAEVVIASKTVQNIRTELRNEGLIRSIPVRDEGGITSWRVGRTNAARKAT